jgi:sulfite reductase alpha subunit-like flavoprotein
LFPAFSRDQENKIYVQQKIKENSKLIKDLLIKNENEDNFNFDFNFNEISTYIILVGNSKILPKYVDKALVFCLKENSFKDDNISEIKDEDIFRFLNKLKNKGFYYTETW